MSLIKFLTTFIILTWFVSAEAVQAPDTTQLAVWANEAIIATYSYDYKNYLARQKEIAKYFTADGWIAYSTALNASKLPETVQKNLYSVSAVATFPPQIKVLKENYWQAVMPILVIYKNPQYQQKQTLEVKIDFKQVPPGQGVRGLAIIGLQANSGAPPCRCQPEPVTTDDKQSSPSEKQSTPIRGQ